MKFQCLLLVMFVLFSTVLSDRLSAGLQIDENFGDEGSVSLSDSYDLRFAERSLEIRIGVLAPKGKVKEIRVVTVAENDGSNILPLNLQRFDLEGNFIDARSIPVTKSVGANVARPVMAAVEPEKGRIYLVGAGPAKHIGRFDSRRINMTVIDQHGRLDRTYFNQGFLNLITDKRWLLGNAESHYPVRLFIPMGKSREVFMVGYRSGGWGSMLQTHGVDLAQSTQDEKVVQIDADRMIGVAWSGVVDSEGRRTVLGTNNRYVYITRINANNTKDIPGYYLGKMQGSRWFIPKATLAIDDKDDLYITGTTEDGQLYIMYDMSPRPKDEYEELKEGSVSVVQLLFNPPRHPVKHVCREYFGDQNVKVARVHDSFALPGGELLVAQELEDGDYVLSKIKR